MDQKEEQIMDRNWSRENYDKSITSRCWTTTPYDSGWEGAQEYPEIREIFAEEMVLESVPAWAAEIVDRMIGPIPPCGHYLFPEPHQQVVAAIGKQKCPDFIFGCFTADSKRKALLSYYVYCLDAWLKKAPLAAVSAELASRDSLGKDWTEIADSVYRRLAKPTESKELLLRLLIDRLRWWVKTCIWSNDRRNRHMLDVYYGDLRGDAAKEGKWGMYGNYPMGNSYAAYRALPEARDLEKQAIETIQNVKQTLVRIESTWLCAPKVFR